MSKHINLSIQNLNNLTFLIDIEDISLWKEHLLCNYNENHQKNIKLMKLQTM